MRLIVPSLFTFSLGSACKGTGGGGAGLRTSPGAKGAGRQGVMSVELPAVFKGNGMDIIGLAVDPGLGGGKAGACTPLAFGGGGAFLESVPFIFTSFGLIGGGGAALWGALSCSVG